MNDVIVVGGGVAGISAALLLRRIQPSTRVTLLENSSSLGGLLKSINVQGIDFDTGVHTFYDSGVDEIDSLMYSITPEGGWVDLTGTKRDIGGAHYANTLHLGNAYFGFDHFPDEIQDQIKREFIHNMELDVDDNFTSAGALLESRFGKRIGFELSKIVKKFSGLESNSIHHIALDVLPLKRINLFSDEIASGVFSSEKLRSRLAFPDQRKLPISLVPSKKAYYPNLYSTQRYIDVLERELEKSGVKIILNADIRNISDSNLELGSGVILDFNHLIWTPNPITLRKFFPHLPKKKEIYPIQRTAIVSYLVNERPQMSDLYYAYSLDEKYISHRYSSPANFCENSKVQGKYRFTNEIVFQGDLSLDEIQLTSNKELEDMGILDISSIYLSQSTIIKGGYPDLSIDLINSSHDSIQEIKNSLSGNIHLTGVMSDDRTFFQNDVILKTYNVIKNLES